MSTIPEGFCQCGCGERTTVSDRTVRRDGYEKGKPMRFIKNHGFRSENPRANGGRGTSQGYTLIWMPEHPNAGVRGYVSEHVLVASRALGKPIPKGAHVHHVNGDRTDNRPQNLVVCQNNTYHKLLHYRQRALAECGNPNWRYCQYCKQWDAPENMYTRAASSSAYHRECRNAHIGATGAHKRWNAKRRGSTIHKSQLRPRAA